MKTKTILFVEDDEVLKENYREFLTREFCDLYEASDGEEGLKLYKQHKPDILLLDINLPLLNGVELLEKIREDDHTTKVIMLTGNTDKEFLLKAIELKLTKYLVKPISRKELKESISLVKKEMELYHTSSKLFINLRDNFVWDSSKRLLLKDSIEVSLTKQEIEILSYLFKSLPHSVTYESLLFDIWDEYDDKNFNSLKTAVKKLRKKLPENSIENVYGLGYKLSI